MIKVFYTFDLADPGRYHRNIIDGAYFDWLFSMLAGTGMTFLFRANLAGRAYYHSRLMSAFDRDSIDSRNPQAHVWYRLAETLACCDPLTEAVRAGKRHGVPVWVWWNWNEWHNVRPGYVDLNDRLWYDRPRKYWCTRDGSRFYCGAPDWGDPEVVDRLVGLAQETLGYGVQGVYQSMRSHSWWACWPSPGWADHLEPFGFNDSVVKSYQARYGVDIRYEDFDQDKWLRIKGDQFSSMLAKVGAQVHNAGKSFIVGTEPDRYSLMTDFSRWHPPQPGADYLKLYKDWEAWVADGSIDGLCAEEACPPQLKIEGGDIAPFRQTLGDEFPLYAWYDTARWVLREPVPFSLANWDPHPVEDVVRQLEHARAIGAAGAFLHTMYHFTACDSAGESVGGYGVLPRTEYFDAIRQWTASQCAK